MNQPASLSVARLGAPSPLDLARIGTGTAGPSVHFALELPVLGAGPSGECWTGTTPARDGESAGIRFRANDDYLFGEIRVPEPALAAAAAASESAYRALAAFLQAQGYPALLRSWNYLHDIHRGAGDAERYRQFCVGRHRAVATHAGFELRLPAATVIGSDAPGLQVLFLAGRVPGEPVENPRQVPAWRYPREYGPASPSFARATMLREPGLLLLSGTASVVGHATRHPHDVESQCGEVFTNIRALLAQAATQRGADAAPWVPRVLRVFLRDPADQSRIAPRVAAEFGANAPVDWVRGDICRADLAMEIDGVFAAG